MAARTAQLAFLINQFMAAAQAIAPVFAGIIGGFNGAGRFIRWLVIFRIWRFTHSVITACLRVGGKYNLT